MRQNTEKCGLLNPNPKRTQLFQVFVDLICCIKKLRFKQNNRIILRLHRHKYIIKQLQYTRVRGGELLRICSCTRFPYKKVINKKQHSAVIRPHKRYICKAAERFKLHQIMFMFCEVRFVKYSSSCSYKNISLVSCRLIAIHWWPNKLEQTTLRLENVHRYMVSKFCIIYKQFSKNIILKIQILTLLLLD